MTKRQVQCESCDYVWETVSKMNYVTCPKCLKKTKINAQNGSKREKQPSGKKDTQLNTRR